MKKNVGKNRFLGVAVGLAVIIFGIIGQGVALSLGTIAQNPNGTWTFWGALFSPENAAGLPSELKEVETNTNNALIVLESEGAIIPWIKRSVASKTLSKIIENPQGKPFFKPRLIPEETRTEVDGIDDNTTHDMLDDAPEPYHRPLKLELGL